jgi:hypothetical protein
MVGLVLFHYHSQHQQNVTGAQLSGVIWSAAGQKVDRGKRLTGLKGFSKLVSRCHDVTMSQYHNIAITGHPQSSSD